MKATGAGVSRSQVMALSVMGMGGLLCLAAMAEAWVGVKAGGVADRAQPEMTDKGLAQHRADFEVAQTALSGFRQGLVPALAKSLGTTPEQVESVIDEDYPATARLLAEQGVIGTFAEKGLKNLEGQQHNFEEADSVPLPGLPAFSGGIVDFALGVVVVVAGASLLRQRAKAAHRWPVMALGLVSAAMIILPLGLRIPQKAESAQNLMDSLNPSKAVITETGAHFGTTEAGVTELEAKVIPDLAAALGVSSDQFKATVAKQFPGVAAGIDELPAIVGRYEERFDIRNDVAGDLRTLKRIPIGWLGWFDPVFGVALGAITVLTAAAFPRRAPREANQVGGS